MWLWPCDRLVTCPGHILPLTTSGQKTPKTDLENGWYSFYFMVTVEMLKCWHEILSWSFWKVLPIASLRYLWPISLRYSSTAFVASVFSRKIKCSRSMNRSTSHMAMSDRNSWEEITLPGQWRPHEATTHTHTHYLCLSCALQDVHQSEGHLLFTLHAQQRLQDGTQCSIVVGDVLSKFLV